MTEQEQLVVDQEELLHLLKLEKAFGVVDRDMRQKLFSIKQESLKRREKILDLVQKLGMDEAYICWDLREEGAPIRSNVHG